MALIDKTQTEIQQNLYTGEPAKERRRLRLPSLGLRVSERRLLLIVFDYLLLTLSLILAVWWRTDLLPHMTAVLLSAKWYVTLALVWAVMAVVFDVYDLAQAADAGSSFWSTAAAVTLTGLVYIAIPWLTPPLQNRSYIILFIILAVGMVGSWRILYARLFIQPVFRRRAIVVGAGNSGQALVAALKKEDVGRTSNPYLGTGHDIVGFIDDSLARKEQKVEGIPVLGDSSSLVQLARELEIDEIVIAITDTRTIHPDLFEAIIDCRESGLPIVSMPTIYERLTGRVAIEHASRNIETAAGQQESAFLRLYFIVKRIVDIICALIGTFIVILLIPVIALSNTLTSPGPLFFRQRRVGRGGKEFEVIKFRSMVPDAERQSGAVWAKRGDERITPFGRWLRYSHIDELPQVINVLRGEMSFVGPRPERPEFVMELSRTIPFYRARHSVKPGITGWAQIHQDYGDSIELAKEKLEYDLYYLKRAGMRLDTVIMLRTISTVLGFHGR